MKHETDTIKTLRIHIKKQQLTIEILTRVCDELRQPYNNSDRFHHLYELATNALNQLDSMELIP
jgi:hypothetical protein